MPTRYEDVLENMFRRLSQERPLENIRTFREIALSLESQARQADKPRSRLGIQLFSDVPAWREPSH